MNDSDRWFFAACICFLSAAVSLLALAMGSAGHVELPTAEDVARWLDSHVDVLVSVIAAVLGGFLCLVVVPIFIRALSAHLDNRRADER